MKKTKVLFILFLILCINIIPFSNVNAHSVDLDPEKLISFPWLISNGEGTISIDKSQTGYSLYYQAVEIPNANYMKMQEIQNNGKTTLDALDGELKKLDAECDNLKSSYDKAFDTWKSKTENGASDEEIATAKTAYETAKTNYQNKVSEYNKKVSEYKTKSEEINNNIKKLVPNYVESNWIKTKDRNFSIDLSQFSGDKAFAVWAKLVSSDGTISYDEATYTMSGTKPTEILVESISLDKTSLTITEGDNYTLVATINPSDATNKLVVWSSDNEAVAKVENGKVMAISEGTATITATSKDGNKKATCTVSVIEASNNNNQDNNNPETNTPDNGNSNNNGTTNNNVTDEKKDNTIATGKLPHAGLGIGLISTIILLISGSIFVYIKYRNLRDI